jgi:ketosteroid isomerase-like protein
VAIGNAERVRAVYAEWASGNLRAGTEFFARDISFEPMPDDGRPVKGVEATADYMREFLSQWVDFRIEAEQIDELGDGIIVTERQTATGRSSGMDIDQTFYAAWVFEDGVVVRLRWEMDRESLLEAVGLRP